MLLLALACTPTATPDQPALGDPALGVGAAAPAFSLEDVNETSATFGEMVGQDHGQGLIGVWYFGHAT